MNYINCKFKLIGITIFNIFSSITSVLFPLSLMSISDAIVNGDVKAFYLTIMFGIGIIFLQMLLYYVVERFQNSYIKHNIIYVRLKLMEKFLSISYNEFNNIDKAEYISVLLNDIKTLENDYYASILNLISKICLLIFSLIGLYIINPVFLLIIAVVIILMSILPVMFSKSIFKRRKIYMELNSQLNESINECLDGFVTIKSYNIIKKILDIYRERVEKFESSNNNMKNVVALANVVLGASTMILAITIFIIGGYLAINNIVTIGGLVASIQLLMNIIEPTSNIAESYNNINSTKPIRERINKIYNIKVVNQSCEDNSINEIDKIDNIVLENVSYKYKNNSQYILNKINFIFQSGKKYAIIGENGSGKSTLLKIIGNIITDYEGEISINGLRYKNVDEKEIYNNISFIHQNSFLFNTSIKNNILLFNNANNTNMKNINELLDLLSLNNEIKLNTNDDNYSIGYNGENLSGGERQKIAIMRALLRQKDVLLVDEANSALDSNTSNKVMQIIGELENTLSIVITHRIDESLKNFDYIVLIEKGEISRCMKYEELENLNLCFT